MIQEPGEPKFELNDPVGDMPKGEARESEDSQGEVWLITPEQFKQLPDGTEMISILGNKIVKQPGENATIDKADQKYGYLGFGFLEKDKPAGIEFKPDSPKLPIAKKRDLKLGQE